MPEIKKVVSTLMYPADRLKEVREIFDGSDFVQVSISDSETLEKELKDADVALLPLDVDERFLGDNQLKWIHCDHAGLNNSAKPEIFERGIILTGAAGRSAPVLAEHCIYFMFLSCYHTRELMRAQDNCQWGVKGQDDWRGLYGRTAGIIGMGNNGRMLADRLHAFGMKIISYDRYETKGYDYIERKLCGGNGDSIDPLLEESDFIILCAALNDDTYHMLNAAAFAKMKDGVTVVNMSRGPLIDTPALIDALNSGKVGCAGLDVFEEEPLLADNPLWHMENVYITPHVTPQVPDRTGRSIEIMRENVRRYRAGEPMLNQMRQTDVYQANGAQEVTGPFGIDSKVKDIMTDDATTRTLLDILEECRGMRQQKGALYMISKYKVRQLFQLMKIPTTEEKLAEYDRRLKDSYQK